MELQSTPKRPKRKAASVAAEALSILMIDDHPTQVEGYSSILKEAMPENLRVSRCFTFEDAFSIISNRLLQPDLVFLDMTMPSFPAQKIFSGEDMAEQIRRFLPESKLIILTAHSEAFILYNIVKKIEPEGVLVKSDFHGFELREAVRQVLRGETYYSATVKSGMRELLRREKFLDAINRQIIVLLAQGIKTKQMPQYIQISLSAIEKRKAQLKDYFFLNGGTDEQIVDEARRLGFV